MKNTIRAASLALALLTAASTAQGQAIVSATGAVINSGGPGDGNIADTYNQNGLASTYTSGVTDFATYIGTNPMHTSTFAGFEWFSTFGTNSASVTYNLGSLMQINALALWNEESSGIGYLNLFSSVNGTNFTALSLGLTPFDNPVADYGPEVFSFASTGMQYLRLDMDRCPQADPGQYTACAIGEVAFRTAGTTVPEPSTYVLMAAGLAGLGVVARRRRSV